MSLIPEKMLVWPLYGTGLEKLGKDDKPCLIDIPEIADDELLAKIDAIGLCFSDIKLIRAGEDQGNYDVQRQEGDKGLGPRFEEGEERQDCYE